MNEIMNLTQAFLNNQHCFFWISWKFFDVPYVYILFSQRVSRNQTFFFWISYDNCENTRMTWKIPKAYLFIFMAMSERKNEIK